MTRIRGRLDIARPVEEVFDTVADQRRRPRYNPGMVSSFKLKDGPIEIGTRFEAKVLSRGRQLPMSIDDTAFERPRLIASRSAMAGAIAWGTSGAIPSLWGPDSPGTGPSLSRGLLGSPVR